MVGHLFYDAESSYEGNAAIKKETNEFLSVLATDNNHNRGLSDPVCLCNPRILLGGSSDNLENVKASKTSFISAVLFIQRFVAQ